MHQKHKHTTSDTTQSIRIRAWPHCRVTWDPSPIPCKCKCEVLACTRDLVLWTKEYNSFTSVHLMVREKRTEVCDPCCGSEEGSRREVPGPGEGTGYRGHAPLPSCLPQGPQAESATFLFQGPGGKYSRLRSPDGLGHNCSVLLL